MGFFKIKKDNQPQIPITNLFLHLANPVDKVFKPYDTVSGHVVLTVAQPITPEAIEVSLWGLSTVWIRTSHSNSNDSTDYKHYRDHAPLFTVTFNLLPKPQTLNVGQEYKFDFSLRVPERTAATQAQQYKSSNDNRWTTCPHQLPPTFFWSNSRYPDSPDNAEVSYGVTARLVRPDVGASKNFEPLSATAPVLFQPLNPHANLPTPLTLIRHPKNFNLQSSTLTGKELNSIGFRQRMHDLFSSGTPKIDFEAGLEIPDVLHSGSEFRFRLSFDVLAMSANAVQIPAITFNIFKLELQDLNIIRAPRDKKASSMMSGGHFGKDKPEPNNNGYTGQEQDIYRKGRTTLNSIPESKIVVLEDVPSGEKKQMVQARSCEMWFTARVPGTMPASFVSFAIARAYRLKVGVAIEVGGKKFKLAAKSPVKAMLSAR
jgi:hypothetical protein